MNCTAIQTAEAAQETFLCAASSFSWVSLLTPAIIIVSVIVAAAGVMSARKSARQLATLDMIEKTESTPYYRDNHAVFARRSREQNFSALNAPREDSESDKKERQQVVDYLNHYELVSIGILTKILDRDIYREWMAGPFIRDWNAAAGFIQRERWKWDSAQNKWLYYGAVFSNYQKVARMWSNDAVDITKQTSGPPEHPAGPGDKKYLSGKQPQ